MQWYVRDTDLGGIFGPYDSEDGAVLVANRMDSGLVFSESDLEEDSESEDDPKTFSSQDFSKLIKGLELISELPYCEKNGCTLRKAYQLAIDLLKTIVSVNIEEIECSKEPKFKSKAILKELLLPECWGCFESAPEFVISDLNDCGIKLIAAIREEQPPYEISKCMKSLRDLQVKYNKHGAGDLGGRSAVRELVNNACVGTCFDPEKFWDSYYV